MRWRPGEPAATTCIHVFTEIWKRKDYSGPWILGHHTSVVSLTTCQRLWAVRPAQGSACCQNRAHKVSASRCAGTG